MIVTTSAVVVFGCAVVVWGGGWFGCGVALWRGVWEVGVGVLVVGRTVDVGVVVGVVVGVTVVVGVVGVGVVVVTGAGVGVVVGVVTKQRKKVWSAIDR